MYNPHQFSILDYFEFTLDIFLNVWELKGIHRIPDSDLEYHKNLVGKIYFPLLEKCHKMVIVIFVSAYRRERWLPAKKIGKIFPKECGIWIGPWRKMRFGFGELGKEMDANSDGWIHFHMLSEEDAGMPNAKEMCIFGCNNYSPRWCSIISC